jgi:hypothetical protein
MIVARSVVDCCGDNDNNNDDDVKEGEGEDSQTNLPAALLTIAQTSSYGRILKTFRSNRG